MQAATGHWWIRQELDVVPARMLVALRAALVGKADYLTSVADRFDRLLLLLLKFLQVRIDSQSAKYPYLQRIQQGTAAPHESELQTDLWIFLTGTDYPLAERTDVSAGRVDIYIPQPNFRFVIEVKRVSSWSEGALLPLLRQTTAYQQSDIKLGVLAVLDLSDRPAGVPHMDQCMFLRPRSVSTADIRHAIVIRVPGNRRTPSDHWSPAT
ncbi:MAG: hypothetical protein HZA66_18770 [Rhodopseudomonas palustris]|uniref:Uncharacterized protein n=1 Tax=Rhodopseudomonas palustris TaxID=1076 RepID=A0A933RZB6_RHOPL|nr:hypothetical protein [Rhodopseudomonas palustris]